MEKEVYLVNPCKASSLPFWKTNLINIPDNMKIVLEEEMVCIGAQDYVDERYFKLIHRMNSIMKPVLNDRYELVCCEVSEYAEHIADCYDDVSISAGEWQS